MSGTPSPEVTGLICRIPSLEFTPTRLGLLTQGHLSQITERATVAVLDISRAARDGGSPLAGTRSPLPLVLTMTVLPRATGLEMDWHMSTPPTGRRPRGRFDLWVTEY